MLDSDAESAKTFTLAAIVLQLVFLSLMLIFIIIFGALAISSTSITGPGGTVQSTSWFGISGLFLLLFGIFAVAGSVWLILDYVLVYRPLSEGNVQGTESSALVLSILQIILGGLIPGILMLIAYLKIKDSLSSQRVNQYQFNF